MKRKFATAVALLLLSSTAWANSTINATNKSSWGANIGWTNWRPSAADGVAIGEYVCSGYIYGANVGWIRMGSGTPANNIQYSNATAADFGVNYSIDPTQPGHAVLRGFAYGANIGWINFHSSGNPRLRFSDGRLDGYAWSANCGWINLGDGTFALSTDSVTPGRDSDGDGIADAFEFQFFGGLAMNGMADSDGDGTSDLAEYLHGTDPLNASDRFRITLFAASPGGTSALLTWTSTAARLYQLEVNPDLRANNWSIDPGVGLITPDAGVMTTRGLTAPASTKRFYRVRVVRPLLP